MRVVVRHGHFAFYPSRVEDVQRFQVTFGQRLVPERDYYTFPALARLPDFSIKGLPYGLVPATAHFAGEGPWAVMRANALVLSLVTFTVVPAASVVMVTPMPESNYTYMPNVVLVQPGARTALGAAILSYDAELVANWQGLRVRSYGP